MGVLAAPAIPAGDVALFVLADIYATVFLSRNRGSWGAVSGGRCAALCPREFDGQAVTRCTFLSFAGHSGYLVVSHEGTAMALRQLAGASRGPSNRRRIHRRHECER